jgi:biotin carboxyl carrier protein
LRNYIPLAGYATSGNLRRQHQAARFFSSLWIVDLTGAHLLRAAVDMIAENAMPEIKILSEVAGRICSLPLVAGDTVGEGDEVAFVEAMKMEIPVASPAAGKIKSILVVVDDVVAEGQLLGTVET